jgi:hypothetical protein
VHSIISALIIFLGLLALVSNGGRGGLIGVFVYSLFFLYMVGIFKIRINTIFLGLSFLYIALFVVFEMHSISNSIIRGVDINLLERLEGLSSKLVSSIVYVFQYSAHRIFIIVEIFKNPDVYSYPRLGADNVASFVVLIPGMNPLEIGLYEMPDIISQDVMGKTNGVIPPGWIGWALLNGGYFWLFLKVAYSALIASIIDKSKKTIVRSLGFFWGSYCYFVLILLFTHLLFSGTSANLIRGFIGAILFFVVLFFVPGFRAFKLKITKSRG